MGKNYWEDHEERPKATKQELGWLGEQLGGYLVPPYAPLREEVRSPEEGPQTCCSAGGCGGDPAASLVQDVKFSADGTLTVVGADFSMLLEEKAGPRAGDASPGGFSAYGCVDEKLASLREGAYARLEKIHARKKRECLGLALLMGLAAKAVGAEEEALHELAARFE